MTTKSFFYASAGVFLLTGAYTMGARHANALNHTGRSHVIALSGNHVLRSDGTPWHFGGGSDWVNVSSESNPYTPLPVAIKDIEFWSQSGIVTKNGVGWSFSGNGWKNLGPIPDPDSAPDESSSWSGVKEGYRK